MALTGQLLVPFDPAGLLVRKNADTVLEVLNRQSALGDNPRLLFIAPPPLSHKMQGVSEWTGTVSVLSLQRK